ncbi:hypothetical protein SVIOM342S_01084 [Streptomyces violaceorubidus]
MRGVFALPAEAPESLSSSAFFPPELLEQPARVRAAAAARATAGANLRERACEERSIFSCTSLCDGRAVCQTRVPDPRRMAVAALGPDTSP